MKTAVYWHMNADGDVLYVGASGCPVCRMSGHASASCWAHQISSIRVQWFQTRPEARAFERAEIHRLKPPHNREWQNRSPRHWVANQGHVYVQNWLSVSGSSVSVLAERLGIRKVEADRLAGEVVHVRIPKAISICVATDGYVPRYAWRKDYAHIKEAPRLRFPTAYEAKQNLEEAVECAARGSRAGLSPYVIARAEMASQ